MHNSAVFILFLSLICCGCSDRTFDPMPFDASQTDYYPLRLGSYIVYQVDSVVYDPSPGGGIARDSSSTLVKEVVADTLPDNNGQRQYLIERYERLTSAEPWKFKFACSAAIINGQAIRTELNFRFLKMLFPMDIHSHWDGNLWIDKNREIEIAKERMLPFVNWDYAVDSIDVPAIINGFTFDSTLRITEVDETNIIEKRFSRSIYAKNVGLVQREQWILDSQYCNQSPPPADCETRPWQEKAEKGYILRQTVLEYQ